MTNDLPTAYPLQWPIGRPRTIGRIDAAFHKAHSHERHSIADGTGMLIGELRLMDAGNIVISTNLRVGVNGYPLSKQSAPVDPGVALYFLRGDQNVCLACDKWSRVEDNLWATLLTVEAMRGLERWGAASLEATFTGYVAIAAPPGSLWHEVLGVSARASAAEILAAYRAKAKALHPDTPGGSHEAFVKLQEAMRTVERLGLVAA